MTDSNKTFASPLDAALESALIATGDLAPAAEAAPASAFDSLGLHPGILKALLECGYTEPTNVQLQAIPAFLAGHDLLVSSQTGSGKTAAFMLPALHRIAEQPQPERPRFDSKPDRVKGRRPRPAAAKPSVLVLTPTRELALQVTTATVTYGKHLRRIVCASVLGGMPYPKQLDMLAKMPDILVATPGRLLDHIGSGRIDLSALQMLVFDEADRMLDMGFSDDIDAIVDATPESRQTLMFSATMDGKIGQLAGRMLKNPVRIEITGAKADQSNIEQRLHFADDLGHKHKLLDAVLRDADMKQAIVFTATKRDADSLADMLADTGFSTGALHGDMNQGARNRTLTALRRGNIQVLVATDVAARGIDVPDITHVVNFDLPKQAEDYVHRIGRTGRAGRSGLAINLVNHNEMFNWKRIERFIDKRLDATTIAGLEPKRSPKPSFGGKPGGRPGQGRPGGGYAGKSSGGYQGRSSGGGYQGRSSSEGYQGRSSTGGYQGSAPQERSFGGQQDRGFGAPAQDRSFAPRQPSGFSGGYVDRAAPSDGYGKAKTFGGARTGAGASRAPRTGGGGYQGNSNFGGGGNRGGSRYGDR